VIAEPHAATRPHQPVRDRTDSVLVIRRLARRFGARNVVSAFDLELQLGERVALRGPNGSGKTTILRCIAGTLAPSSGTILVCGHPAGSLAARALVGVSLSQERSFSLRLSGWHNLVFFARLRGASRRDAEHYVRALGDELQLEEILSERVDRCSTGMVQQLGFARSLLSEPELLLLDEPSRSLDRDARERMWAALARRPGTSVLVATHLDDDLARCDRRVDL
jgi:ABC-2 type transport system ATP-binding protein